MSFLSLETMPGFDVQALPAPNWDTAAEEEYVSPADELEAQIQAVWQEVLLQDCISTQSDFFTVGGNSLQARHPQKRDSPGGLPHP